MAFLCLHFIKVTHTKYLLTRYQYDHLIGRLTQTKFSHFQTFGTVFCNKTQVETKLLLDWKHFHENCLFILHGKWACLHHLDVMQQNCCIYIHIRWQWFMSCMTQTMKQEGILWTGTSLWCMMEKYTPQFCLVLPLSLISLGMRTLWITLVGRKYGGPLHDAKVGVWCAVSVTIIIGPVFFVGL